MWNETPMRLASLLPCLALAACMLTGEETPPEAAIVAAAVSPAPAAPAVTSQSAARSSSVGGGARGGATTASAQGGEPVEVPPDPLTQARVDCWMKVESQQGLRAIDQRSAFVDKCVAAQLKSKPSP